MKSRQLRFWIFLLPMPILIHVSHAEVPSGKVSAGMLTGDNWIQNEKVKVTVEGRSVSVHVRDVNTDAWNRLSLGQLQGLLTPDELLKPFRKKNGGYYLFGEETAVENLKTEMKDGSAVIRFRTRLEDLWIDTQIKILAGSAFVFTETVGRSADSLVPHWSLSFHRPWESSKWWMPAMTHLLFDDPATSKPKSMAAVNHRDSHKSPLSARYCIAYRPGIDRLWGVLWPPEGGQPSGRRRIQFPPGAIVVAYLDTPYVLFSEITDVEKNEETMSGLGEKLYKQMSTFF